MKIKYVIVSSDDNSLYFDFWDIVKKLWIKVAGIKPILVKIDSVDEVNDFGDFIIHKIKKIDGIDTGFQSQISRMFITKYYKDNVCLTSDIDMLPMSKNYFSKNIEQYDNDSLLIFSSDAYQNQSRYPICYNAAKGSLFTNILNLDVSFEEYCHRLMSYNWGWDTDELYYGLMVNGFFDQEKIIKLNRGWVNGIAKDRIDRVRWRYDIDKLRSLNYIDSHSLRPYSQYKDNINQLLSYLLI